MAPASAFPPAPDPDTAIVHASCVAAHGRALLIRGASGSGKSGLSLDLMALGAALVADDRVRLSRAGGQLLADAPVTIRGLIEARGLGLLHATPHGPAPVAYVLDLDRAETERLPPPRRTTLLGQSVPLLLRADGPHLAAALIQLLAGGRQGDT